MRKLLTLVFLLSLSLTPAFARQRLFGFCELGNQTVAVQGFVSPTLVQASYPQCTVTVYLANSQSVSTAKYLSGGTISGTAGQTVTFFLNGGSTGAIATATLSATNTIAPGSTLTINTPGAGYSGPPTTATCSSGTATCSGTVQITSTVIGTLASLYADNNGTVLSNPFIASKQGAWYFYPDNGRYDVQFTLGTPNPFPTPFTEGDQLAVDPLFDTEFPSVTQACTFAAALPATLTVTRAWLNLPTQTFACDLLFQAGGRFQPGSGQVLTLGTVRAGLYKIFDDSAGGTIGSLKAQKIYPDWWGVLPDACTAAVASFSGLTIVTPWTGLAAQTFTCPMAFEPGGLIDAVAGAQLVVQYPTAALTQQIYGLTGTIYISNPAAKLSIAWWGAKGDDSTDDTIPIAAALSQATSANSVGTIQHVYAPSGIFRTSPLTQLDYGLTFEGEGPTSTIIKSLTGAGNVFDLTPPVNTAHGVVLKNFGVDGNGGAANVGISIHSGPLTAGVYNFKIENVIVNNVGAQCILAPEYNTFEVDIDHAECASLHGNGIEIRSGPTAVIQNSIVETVGPGMVGYRIYGNAVMISDNGLTGNIPGTIALQIGQVSPILYGGVTLINCNLEDFGSMGIDVIQGSFHLINSQFIANQPGSTNVKVINFETTIGNFVSEIDAQSVIYPTANYANGYAIHAAGSCQPLLVYNSQNAEVQYCYSESLATAYNTLQYVGTSVAFGVTALGVNELQTPDFWMVHTTAMGAKPTITAPFGASGDVLTGFDAAGQIVIGTAPTNQSGTIAWASTPGYLGVGVNCTVNYLAIASGVENGTVNIAAPSGGVSVVTWVSATKFNTGWPSGMPIVLSIGGSVGVLSNNIISAVASPTSMTITPGVPGGSVGAFYIMPIRNQYLSWIAGTSGLSIRSTYNFVPGDVLNWQCIGR